ncbi:MAG: ABC transporter permease subunit [Lachnospiraceae bacterium]|nr:ABC transporter permease subunit [Lachnospiraceae bacterium]
MKKVLKSILPLFAVIIASLLYYLPEDTGRQKKMDHPYSIYVFVITLVVYILLLLIQREKTLFKAPLFAGVIIFLGLINYVTTKTELLPTLFFPSLDRIFGLLWEQREFLLKNVVSSLKLLAEGALWGLVIGFFTGIALGYFKQVGYWLNPVTKFIGPIPTTAWIPLALSIFETSHEANVFLIAFAVWFPVTLMTSSGIQSTGNVYFEVSRTLGASTFYQIFHVAVPAAMPSIFLGLFYGTVSSFATLMAVEMNGNSSGIGWYINWQKQVMLYDGVYAGLILIALICTLSLTLLFKVRDKILTWQKGVIKW